MRRRARIWGWTCRNEGCERANGRKPPLKGKTLLKGKYPRQTRYEKEMQRQENGKMVSEAGIVAVNRVLSKVLT